jgi:hypothetical protein
MQKGVTPILNVSDMAAVPQTRPRTQTARFAWFAKWGWGSCGIGERRGPGDLIAVSWARWTSQSEKQIPHTARKVRERVRDDNFWGRAETVYVGGGAVVEVLRASSWMPSG